jgi:cytochrome c2
MKTKKIKFISLVSIMLFAGVIIFASSCVESQKVAMKSGPQLWAENCQRCHNTPSPTAFSANQWETIGLHMQSRALLTEKEKNKIVAFLQGVNQ